jgi:hypothetical protein
MEGSPKDPEDSVKEVGVKLREKIHSKSLTG